MFIVGGPAINEINPATAEILAGLPFARDRDIVLYNQRGVGFARPRLGCPEFDVVRAARFPARPGHGGGWRRSAPAGNGWSAQT